MDFDELKDKAKDLISNVTGSPSDQSDDRDQNAVGPRGEYGDEPGGFGDQASGFGDQTGGGYADHPGGGLSDQPGSGFGDQSGGYRSQPGGGFGDQPGGGFGDHPGGALQDQGQFGERSSEFGQTGDEPAVEGAAPGQLFGDDAEREGRL